MRTAHAHHHMPGQATQRPPQLHPTQPLRCRAEVKGPRPDLAAAGAQVTANRSGVVEGVVVLGGLAAPSADVEGACVQGSHCRPVPWPSVPRLPPQPLLHYWRGGGSCEGGKCVELHVQHHHQTPDRSEAMCHPVPPPFSHPLTLIVQVRGQV